MKYKIEIDNAGCIVVKGREKQREQWKKYAWINEKSSRIFIKGISPEQKKEIDQFLRKRGIKVNSQGYAHQ